MNREYLSATLAVFLCICFVLTNPTANAQSATLSGTVTDTSQGALPGARISLNPLGASTVSGSQGQYTVRGIAPGTYTLTVSYVGFSTYQKSVTVTDSQVTSMDVVMHVASESQQVLVTAGQAHGEAETINLELTTPNILDVLPAELITSLPNANIADAVGRLPGVTLERDEGEGKYVQIRGTEPRLANLTIDGIIVPSPEGGVRQVKLDTIPADIVQSVQIYKTLQADQPGDAIGGSVNLETKMAGDHPTLSITGLGGLTPIINTVPVTQGSLTAGKRFGAAKRLGVMFSGAIDYNWRGIDDIEPLPAIQAGPANFTDMDIREYQYDRRRFGFALDLEYKVNPNSRLWVRSLFSNFLDYGHRYDYALATLNSVNGPGGHTFNTERRLGEFLIADLVLGGDHSIGKWSLNWEASVARASNGNPINGGENIVSFNYNPTLASSSNCQYVGATDPNLPQFNSDCFTELYNPSNFVMTEIADTNHGITAQRNLQGSVSSGRSYKLGTHVGLLRFGAWMSNAHKFDDSYENDWFTNIADGSAGSTFMNLFVDNFKNSNYYNGAYKYGPGISWEASKAYLAANPGAFTLSSNAGGNTNNFDLVERITSGYLMNTLDLGRFSLYAGIRFESTLDNTYSVDLTVKGPPFPESVKGNNSYVDPLPSASIQMKLDQDSDLRLAYGRGISRPDPQFLTASRSIDQSTFPPTVTVGNPALIPEHANDFDVLYERSLHPIGLIRGGFFYKNLSDPIVNQLKGPGPDPVCTAANLTTCYVSQATNAGSAYIAGLEFSFQQHLSYLPGLLGGIGIDANYSWATSQATNVNPGNRTDKPALLRQAPRTWNISPSYDHGRLSMRGGISYNGPNIYQYAYTDANGAGAGGISGPAGDLYLFAHFQTDAEASFRVRNGLKFLFQGLNLNNEVFGFYNGSQQYFIQREYYQPTYTFGCRWDLDGDR